MAGESNSTSLLEMLLKKTFNMNSHIIDIYICLQAKIGRQTDLEAVLQRLRGNNACVSQEAADIMVT